MYPKFPEYITNGGIEKRDHDKNHICDYSVPVDGTLGSAAWESGMDNAIGFNGYRRCCRTARMHGVLIRRALHLNAYLSLEQYLCSRNLLDCWVSLSTCPDYRGLVAHYFFDQKDGFPYDRRLDADRSFCT